MAIEPIPPDAGTQDTLLRLNALVDGELPASERAALAERMVVARDLARAHATLARLKACVGEVGEVGTVLPEVAGPFRRRRMAGIAAGVAAFVVLGTGLAAHLSSLRDPEPAAVAPSHAVIRVAAMPSHPVVPDLAPAGLKLAGIAMETASDMPAVIATYHGPRGCRLELRVFADGAMPPSMLGTARRSWVAGGLSYELVAFGMPAARFAAVAAAAEHAVRGAPGEAPGWREARAAAPPCVG